jgi:DNA-binding Lrp family transcriptional regulator
MDKTDKSLLNSIQTDFPITERPYRELGRLFKISEQEVINRIDALKKQGIIRRIGGNFNTRKLNFTSTLCAAKVDETELDHFIGIVNRYPGVTHNYLRNHEYNVWFTFIAENMEEIQRSLEEISTLTGVKAILNLPAVKMFKIRVEFSV